MATQNSDQITSKSLYSDFPKSILANSNLLFVWPQASFLILALDKKKKQSEINNGLS